MKTQTRIGIWLVIISAILISSLMLLAIELGISPFLGLITGSAISFIIAYIIPSHAVKREFKE